MSRLRQATTISDSGGFFRPRFLFNVALVSALVLGGNCAFGSDDQFVPSLETESLSNPVSGTGLVLPISNPLPLAAQQPDIFHDSSFSTLAGDFDGVPVEPIPVPLPPGVATGMIGLVAAAIARYRWRLRRA